MSWQFNNGRLFVFLPVKCIDGRWAWLRMVYFADVNDGLFYSPYTVTRFYSIDPGSHNVRAALTKETTNVK